MWEQRYVFAHFRKLHLCLSMHTFYPFIVCVAVFVRNLFAVGTLALRLSTELNNLMKIIFVQANKMVDATKSQ